MVSRRRQIVNEKEALTYSAVKYWFRGSLQSSVCREEEIEPVGIAVFKDLPFFDGICARPLSGFVLRIQVRGHLIIQASAAWNIEYTPSILSRFGFSWNNSNVVLRESDNVSYDWCTKCTAVPIAIPLISARRHAFADSIPQIPERLSQCLHLTIENMIEIPLGRSIPVDNNSRWHSLAIVK